MSALFVGQRVKKVRGVVSPGITGTVVGFDTLYEHFDFIVRLDFCAQNTAGEAFVAGECAEAISQHWEPILPSGHQPAELDVHELLPFLKEQKVTA